MGIQIGSINIGKILNGSTNISKIYNGNNLIYESEKVSETLMTVSEAGTYTLNLYKEDTEPTTVFVDGSLYGTYTTSGSQDVEITISENANTSHTIKLKNKGNWYFDNYCLGSEALNNKLIAINFTKETKLAQISAWQTFYNTAISTVTIPSCLTSIGAFNPFSHCSAIASIQVAADNTVYHSANNCCIQTAANKLIFGCKNSVIPTDGSVTNIGYSAFNGCSGLISITIPDNITSIESQAFNECTGLTSVTIGASLTELSSSIFANCSSLSEITIPNNITVINNDAFNYCDNLATVSMGTGITSIGTHVFRGCALSSIEIPANVTSIGEAPFYACNSLTTINWNAINCTTVNQAPFAYANYITSINIGSNVQSLPNSAFYGTKITSIAIPNSVGSIGNYAFGNCTSLTSVSFGTGLRTIEFCAFWNCTSLSSITLPSGITSLGAGTFSTCSALSTVNWNIASCTIDRTSWQYDVFASCSNLTTINIGTSTTSIPAYAFEGCTALTSLTIPSNVTSIGSCALHIGSTSNLSTIIFLSTTPCTIASGTFYTSWLKKIVVPTGCKATYIASSSAWSLYSDYISEYASTLLQLSVSPATTFTLNLYKADTETTIIYVDNSLVSTINTTGSHDISFTTTATTSSTHYVKILNIGNWYFDNYCLGSTTLNKYLVAVDFSGETLMTAIGTSAFYYCNLLTSITIPNSVTSIGNNAFYQCSKLATINLSTALTSIGQNSFASCSVLTDIQLASPLQQIGYGAFFNCNALTSLTIPSTVTSLGNRLFSGCSKLTSLSVDSNNTVYHSNQNCIIHTANKKLVACCKSSVLPTDNSVTSIGAYALASPSPTSVTLSSYITTIDANAFYSSDITSITIPNTVTSIGSSAFSGCTSLTSITLGTGISSLPDSAFATCSSLTTISIPSNIKSIGSYTFSSCSSLTTITIPDNVTSIGSSAFKSCTSLLSAIIGSGVTSIGNGAFSGCSKLTSITIPFVGAKSGVTSSSTYQYPFGYIFGTSSYTGGTSTSQTYHGSSSSSTTSTTYYIPTTLKTVTVTGGNILYGAFHNCGNLASITLPSSLTRIEDWAFRYCSTKVAGTLTIPKNVTYIGNYGLAMGSSSYKPTITFESKTPCTITSSTFYYSYYLNKIYVPIGCKATYVASSTYWSNVSSYIYEEELPELCFTANTAGSTVELLIVGSPSISNTAYSTDRVTWTTFTPSTTAGTNTITLTNAGDKVYFRNSITAALSSSNYMKFKMSGSIAASGNVNSMYIYTDFNSLTTLAYAYCYYRLFYACSSLTSAPTLPATAFSASYCYYSMFESCSKLTVAPDLPITKMYTSGYANMFAYCTSLTTPPALPATSLNQMCYSAMFRGCTSLTSVPALPATYLYQLCYNYMFYGCTNLYVSDSSGTGYTNAWKIPTSGTFTNSSTYNQQYMFTNCKGTRSSDDMSGANGGSHTYYTQNTPIS